MSTAGDAVMAATDTALAIELTREMVRVPSVVGAEEAIGLLVERRMRELGFEDVHRQEVFPGRANVVGSFDFGPGPHIVLTGHLDTKPVCVGWERDPYGGDLEGERLYGHAIMDMKAGLAGQVAAARSLALSGERLRGRVTVVGVCDHMGQQGGARAYFSANRADMAVLGELTNNRVAVGHRGRFYWDIRTYGRSAHTCDRHEAINALAKAAEVVLELEKLRHMPPLDDATRALFGPELYTAVGRIYAGLPPEGPSMIPDNCTLRVDSRPQPGVSAEHVRGVLVEAVERVAARDPELRWDITLADEKPPHLIAPDAPVVRYAREASRLAQGGDATVVGMSWLGDTSTFGPWVPTVIYGPGHDPVYMPNEYLDLEDIRVATRVYALTAFFALSRGPGE